LRSSIARRRRQQQTFADTDVTSDKEYVGIFRLCRIGQLRLRQLGLGIAGSYTDHTGTGLPPSFRSAQAASFFRATPADGERTRFAPQFYYYAGSLGVIGEYTEVSQDVSRVVPAGVRGDTPCRTAASFFLSDEEAASGLQAEFGVFARDGTWGGWEIARVPRTRRR
jgi:phosphate-selective porin OprO/OprP